MLSLLCHNHSQFNNHLRIYESIDDLMIVLTLKLSWPFFKRSRTLAFVMEETINHSFCDGIYHSGTLWIKIHKIAIILTDFIFIILK